MEGDSMMKYQEPEMNIIEIGRIDVITASGETLVTTPSGGNGGLGWGDL